MPSYRNLTLQCLTE
ncbi:hypothetical protein CICLE_v100187641mg, partial [Citrus x clementina]